jgi:hypothetical protein
MKTESPPLARIGEAMGTDPQQALVALLREHRMLLFVGAGLSLDLGYPLWESYLAALERELDVEAPPLGDPLERAEWIKQAFAEAHRHDDYLAHIQQTFGPKPELPYTPLQLALLRLAFRGVITTNYEPSLEIALSAENHGGGRLPCTGLDLGDARSFGVSSWGRPRPCPPGRWESPVRNRRSPPTMCRQQLRQCQCRTRRTRIGTRSSACGLDTRRPCTAPDLARARERAAGRS